jgi:hypothetical protein
VVFDNFFTLSSEYCLLDTTAVAFDGRYIECVVEVGSNKVTLKNMKLLPTGTTFKLTVEMSTTSAAATISPTVSIYTKIGAGNLVDQV